MDFRKLTLASVATLLFSPAAFSQNLYFGIFGGHSSADLPRALYDSDLDALVRDEFGLASNYPLIIDSSIEDGVAWGIQIGYSFNQWVALEIGYTDLGEASYEADVRDGAFNPPEDVFFTHIDHRSSGPTLAVLGTYPINERFAVHAKAGLFFSDNRVAGYIEDIQGGEVQASGKDLLFGIGGSWNFSESYALRLEWQRFKDVGDEDETGEVDADLIALTFLFR